jgi:hypothetical protein
MNSQAKLQNFFEKFWQFFTNFFFFLQGVLHLVANIYSYTKEAKKAENHSIKAVIFRSKNTLYRNVYNY